MRTGLRRKFPANREINREFCGFRPSTTILVPRRRANSMACSRVPYAMEQGIFVPKQAMFCSEQGILVKTSGAASARVCALRQRF